VRFFFQIEPDLQYKLHTSPNPTESTITTQPLPSNIKHQTDMSNSLNLTATIGGRLVSPALPTVDSSPSPPSELLFNESLKSYISNNVPLEPVDGIQRRERVLMKMASLCREWVKSVALKRGWGEDMASRAGGELFTSGSYRLGVHEPGADIDTIVVAPSICTRDDFFGSNYMPENAASTEEGGGGARDPTSLAERIRVHPDVTNFVPVEGAAVPILTFDWEGVNIDLLFARLNASTVPPNFDIDNDAVLNGVDSATEKSLNGPRVTNLIAALASGTDERYQTFLTVVRLVRKWAKSRGLYSNKMGYWGGVNINIAVALVLQLYPNACPASLLRKFFLVFKSWRWPNPVMLTKPHDAELGLPVWNALQASNMRQVAPMITPAYPAMNSTLSVSRQTLQILHEEFCRGHNVVDKLYKDFSKGDVFDKEDIESGEIWKELFRPSDFFIGYPHYLSLCIVGPSQSDAQAWAGFVESRLRKLVCLTAYMTVTATVSIRRSKYGIPIVCKRDVKYKSLA
jgi:poly(A) polymerase